MTAHGLPYTGDTSSYYALRRADGAEADAWWAVARRRPDIPGALSALAAGRARVELDPADLVEALAWAERLDAGPAPLQVYPRDPRGG